jgi:3-phenylpropionate/cinnamic acid dioxygenase small subunit
MNNGSAQILLQYAVEQFFYFEAGLLDERRFDEWLDLFDDDVRYWMPTRFNRLRKDMTQEFSTDTDVALFDEDKRSLEVRVKRLKTGRAWAEEPSSRTRHMINNVRIFDTDSSGDLDVRCNFYLYRSRGERQVDHFVGTRVDLLRPAAGNKEFKIAKRTIFLDQSVILANNLSVFF